MDQERTERLRQWSTRRVDKARFRRKEDFIGDRSEESERIIVFVPASTPPGIKQETSQNPPDISGDSARSTEFLRIL